MCVYVCTISPVANQPASCDDILQGFELMVRSEISSSVLPKKTEDYYSVINIS